MNDRVSAVPPADFLGDGRGGISPTGGAEYERQFALDWKPPELQFGRDNGGGGGDNVLGSRSSFMSVRSGMTSFTTRTGAPSLKTARGLFGKVKEKLTLHKSRSNWTVGGDNEDEHEGGGGGDDGHNDVDAKSSFLANFPIPPVFKHKRSESMDQGTLRANQRCSMSDDHATSEFGVFRAAAAAGANNKMNRPPLPVRADSLGLPSTYDPTKRPTREEITANYQSLLASGFFGTRAIQSTRFSPPGANLNRRSEQQRQRAADAPTFAQRLEEVEGEASSVPPSPLREPPPVPSPSREAPPPPPSAPPAMDMDMEMEMEEEESAGSESATPTAIPASLTAIFNPLPPSRTTTTSRGADTTMSPPPLPNQRQQQQTPTHKPSHKPSFHAIPYTSTRPGVEPTNIQRPYRPPPVTLARFSVDHSRQSSRSLDIQPSRGTKRPFSSAAANASQTSFYTDRTSYDYDPMAMDGHGGIGLATTTLPASPEKVESGARKFVKRLRKSASKLKLRSQSSLNQCGGGDQDGEEEGAELQQPPSRTSMSSNARRSFSWRIGGGSKPDAVPSSLEGAFIPQHHHATSVSSFSSTTGGGHNSIFGNGRTFSLKNAPSINSSMDNFHPPPPSFPTDLAAAPTMGQSLPAIAASPNTPGTADRNHLKKRDIRMRRLRRKEEGASTGTGSPLASGAMEYQMPQSPTPASPSKRPRRSGASIFMRALETNNHDDRRADGKEEEEEEETDYSESELPAPSPADMPSAAPSEGMEGVEFSFHFPGRTRPSAGGAGSSGSLSGHGPLVVVPSVNRGLPSISNTLGNFRARKTGSVRVVRAE